MSTHLFTFLADRKRVECTCQWGRRADGRAAAMRLHLDHILNAGPDEKPVFLRVPRSSFVPTNSHVEVAQGE